MKPKNNPNSSRERKIPPLIIKNNKVLHSDIITLTIWISESPTSNSDNEFTSLRRSSKTYDSPTKSTFFSTPNRLALLNITIINDREMPTYNNENSPTAQI